MEKFLKNGTIVNIALENQLGAKVYRNTYMNNGRYINFTDVRNFFYERGSECNYYLLFATIGDINFWYGIIDWRNSYKGNTAPRIVPLYNGSDVRPGITNNLGTIEFNSPDTFYQVTPVGI